jgi:hypothetical protein
MRYDRDLLLDVLIYHQRQNIGACHCGPLQPGSSYCEHVRDVYEKRITEDPQPGGLHANDTSPWRGEATEWPTPEQAALE